MNSISDNFLDKLFNISKMSQKCSRKDLSDNATPVKACGIMQDKLKWFINRMQKDKSIHEETH